jgi:Ras-related protein Rab-18
VSKDEGLKFARKHSMLFIEASAKTKEGVQIAFEELVEKILQTPGLWDIPRNTNVNMMNQQQQQNSYCNAC